MYAPPLLAIRPQPASLKPDPRLLLPLLTAIATLPAVVDAASAAASCTTDTTCRRCHCCCCFDWLRLRLRLRLLLFPRGRSTMQLESYMVFQTVEMLKTATLTYPTATTCRLPPAHCSDS